MSLNAGFQLEANRNIPAKRGDQTVPYTVTQSATGKDSLMINEDKKQILPHPLQRFPPPIHGQFRGVFSSDIYENQGLRTPHLEDDCKAMSSADDQTCGKTDYSENISRDESRQFNGTLYDGHIPPPMPKGKATYTGNESRDRSLQVNGLVPAVHIFQK